MRYFVSNEEVSIEISLILQYTAIKTNTYSFFTSRDHEDKCQSVRGVNPAQLNNTVTRRRKGCHESAGPIA